MECKVVRGGNGGDPGVCSCPIHTTLASSEKDRGMDYGAAVDSKRDRTGCSGMDILPLS